MPIILVYYLLHAIIIVNFYLFNYTYDFKRIDILNNSQI